MNLFSSFLFTYFERPFIFYLFFPILLFLLYFLRKDFFKMNVFEDAKRKKFLRIFVFIMRFLIFCFLLLALANPFKEITTTLPGDAHVKIFVDHSFSMDLFNLSFLPSLKTALEKEVPVEIFSVAQGEESNIGEGVLSTLKKNDHVLLISDGNNNKGLSLGDLSLHLTSLNASLSLITLKTDVFDASVAVYGPDKITVKSENTYTVLIKKTLDKTVHVRVRVDGVVVLDKITKEHKLTFKQSFDLGYHQIVATLEGEDYFSINNVFYKNVKVVPKPKVLLVSEREELVTLFSPLYDIKKVTTLESDLSGFTAVLLDDLTYSKISPYVNRLIDFVSDGGGLFVLGGKNSYDGGDYKGSRFEQLLPVYVSKVGKKQGDINLVFVIDVSESTSGGFGGYTKVDYEKALVVGMLRNVSLINNVGVVAFNTLAYKVSDLKKLLEQKDLENTIARLTFSGGTDMLVGVQAGILMLQNTTGSRNLIIISDGITGGKESVLEVVRLATSQGMKVYTVGVGGDTDASFMKSLATTGNGVYFEPSASQQLKLLFGEGEVAGSKRVFSLAALDTTHFITQHLGLTAKIYGYNQVVPKNIARLLVTTDVGDPILASWRFGLGRVVSLATDYTTYGFELLNRDNSLLLTRSTNYVIGDPERKNAYFVDIQDGRINASLKILVKSAVQPSSPVVALYKVDEQIYQGVFQSSRLGFASLVGAQFAVNYKEEYEDIGLNPNLAALAFSTNGKIFEASNTSEIIEFIKMKSTRQILLKKSYSWIFLLFALVFYLLEICVRRIVAYRII